MTFYTGVGSRSTPKHILASMTQIAQTLAGEGYVLRSGAAVGADSAFEAGAGGAKIIYLPWRGFRDHTSPHYDISQAALDLAARVHPQWHLLNTHARRLHARNGYQVLGLDLKTKSRFVVCWTPAGKLQGGTAQAMRIAQAYGIPVYNLAAWSAKAVLDRVLR